MWHTRSFMIFLLNSVSWCLGMNSNYVDFFSHIIRYTFFAFVLETHMQNLIMYKNNKVIPLTFSVYISFLLFLIFQVIALPKHMLCCCSHFKIKKREQERFSWVLQYYLIFFFSFSYRIANQFALISSLFVSYWHYNISC